jgi:UTP--glucose-1-phosphate uridylyltransferase
VNDEPFAVLLADDLMTGTPPVLSQMAEIYREFGASVLAVQEVPLADTRKYGIISGDVVRERLTRVRHIVEKPAPEVAPSRLAVAGRYILTPGVFEQIRRQPKGVGGEIQLTDGIAGLMTEEAVYGYAYDGQRYDCGSKEGYLEASVELALKHPEIGPAFAAYLKKRAV